MDPIIGGALISAGSGLLGDLFNLGSQQRTQRETWRREDTAVQRRVADLKAAGLSPTLAAGSAAGSVNTVAPQTQAGEVVGKGIDKALTLMQLRKAKADVRGAEADADLKRADADYASTFTYNKLQKGEMDWRRASTEMLRSQELLEILYKTGMPKAQAEKVSAEVKAALDAYYGKFEMNMGQGAARGVGGWVQALMPVLRAILGR